MTPAAVYTRMKRFAIVKKQSNEVGDGTLYPLQVSLEQLAELMYRVKSAKFTAGKIQISYDLPGSITLQENLNYPANNPQSPNVRLGGNLKRGYFAESSNIGSSGDYFDADYLSNAYRDLGTNERGIWAPCLGNRYAAYPAILYPEYKSAFTYDGINASPFYASEHVFKYEELVNSVTTEYESTFVVRLYGDVAYVDSNSSANPYDRLNKLYVGLKSLGSGSTNDATSTYTGGMVTPTFITNYIISLQTGDLACKMYRDSNGLTNFSVGICTPIKHKAYEWFPYASSSGAVWNSNTGVKI